jgi:hypothetical protein
MTSSVEPAWGFTAKPVSVPDAQREPGTSTQVQVSSGATMGPASLCAPPSEAPAPELDDEDEDEVPTDPPAPDELDEAALDDGPDVLFAELLAQAATTTVVRKQANKERRIAIQNSGSGSAAHASAPARSQARFRLVTGASAFGRTPARSTRACPL